MLQASNNAIVYLYIMCIKYLALGRGALSRVSIVNYYFFVSLSSNIPEELFIVPVTVKGIVFSSGSRFL